MSIYQQHKPSSGGGDFLKLTDGESVKLRIASEPAISVYKLGDKPRYSWVVFNRDQKKAQIYSAGVSVFQQIAALVEDWGEPTEFDIRVSRTGSTITDTKYIVTPVKTSTDLTDDELDLVNAIDLPKTIKGKMLAEYEEDGVLPAPVTNGLPYADDAPAPTDDDAPVDLNDIPDFD